MFDAVGKNIFKCHSAEVTWREISELSRTKNGGEGGLAEVVREVNQDKEKGTGTETQDNRAVLSDTKESI